MLIKHLYKHSVIYVAAFLELMSCFWFIWDLFGVLHSYFILEVDWEWKSDWKWIERVSANLFDCITGLKWQFSNALKQTALAEQSQTILVSNQTCHVWTHHVPFHFNMLQVQLQVQSLHLFIFQCYAYFGFFYVFLFSTSIATFITMQILNEKKKIITAPRRSCKILTISIQTFVVRVSSFSFCTRRESCQNVNSL